MVVESDLARDVVAAHLDAHEIGWGVHYPVPCHRQPAYASHGPDSLPVSESLAERIISLPMYPQLGADRVERVCAVLAELGEA
jgi:dTDP-4-amino-4,6-dideoxygalactose transaminase